jgi:Flp pilus assembly protein TadB
VASTREYGGDGEPIGEQSLGELVATATRDLSMLVHSEIELAKAELAEQAKRASVGAGLLGGAGAFAMLSLLVLCFAAGFGIAAGASIPVWAGFLCVGGLFLIMAAALGGIGARALKNLGGPDLTVSTVKASLASLRHPRRGERPAGDLLPRG